MYRHISQYVYHVPNDKPALPTVAAARLSGRTSTCLQTDARTRHWTWLMLSRTHGGQRSSFTIMTHSSAPKVKCAAITHRWESCHMQSLHTIPIQVNVVARRQNAGLTIEITRSRIPTCNGPVDGDTLWRCYAKTKSLFCTWYLAINCDLLLFYFNVQMHTCIHACIRTSTRIRISTHARTHTRTRTHTCTHAYAHTYANACARRDTRMSISIRTRTRPWTQTHARAHVGKPKHIHIIYPHTQTHPHGPKTHTRVHILTHTHARKLAHTPHTQQVTHTHIHTRARMHTIKHTRTNTRRNIFVCRLCGRIPAKSDAALSNARRWRLQMVEYGRKPYTLPAIMHHRTLHRIIIPRPSKTNEPFSRVRRFPIHDENNNLPFLYFHIVHTDIMSTIMREKKMPV